MINNGILPTDPCPIITNEIETKNKITFKISKIPLFILVFPPNDFTWF